METLHGLWISGCARPAREGHPWVRHVYREHNTEADTLANEVMDLGAGAFKNDAISDGVVPRTPSCARLRCSFDGGQRGSKASSAWIIQVETQAGVWRTWKAAGYFLPGATCATAEATAASALIRFLVKVVSCERWACLRALVDDWLVCHSSAQSGLPF